MQKFINSRAFSLLMCLICLLYALWAVPTCMRGPVTESRLQQQEYYERLRYYENIQRSAPGGMGVASESGNWGLGINSSANTFKHFDTQGTDGRSHQ
jgi:hypothetical protein